MPLHNKYEEKSVERICWLIDTYCEGSQAGFCERTGLHKSTVSKIVNGIHMPSKNSIERIAEVFTVRKDWVNGYDVPMRANPNAWGISLPVLAHIPGGLPLDQITDIRGNVTYDNTQSEEEDSFFAMEITDDSMQPRIRVGDIVIVSTENAVKNDDLVVVAIDGKDAVLRRLKVYENSVGLFADDPSIPPEYFPDMEQERLKIIGRVRELRAIF